MSTSDGMEGGENFLRRKLGWELGQERAGEFNENKHIVSISGDVDVDSSTREMDDCLSCLSSESVVRCRSTCILLRKTSTSPNSSELDDETRKLLTQNFGSRLSDAAYGDNIQDDEKMKMTPLHLELGRMPNGVAHLRNGPVPITDALLRNGCVSKGAALLRNGWVSTGVAYLQNGRVSNETAHQRKKSQWEANRDASTSRDGAKADPTDAPIVTVIPAVTQLPAHDIIIDAIEVAAGIPAHPVADEVVAEEAQIVVEDDRPEIVNDAVEEIAGLGGHGVDIGNDVVVSATVDLGVDEVPIVLGVLSPTDYANLVFNVLLHLPYVDAAHEYQ